MIDYSGSKYIAFDTETYDPDLMILGPGHPVHNGEVVGISFCDENLRTCYLPIRHRLGLNIDEEQVKNYVLDIFRDNSKVFIGANINYDMGWLDSWLGNAIDWDSKELRDVLVAEALIDSEQKSYNLESCGLRYLNRGKDYSKEEEAKLLFVPRGENFQQNIYRMPPELVSGYAEEDARITYEVHSMQVPLIQEYKLENVYEMECQVLKVVHAMNKRGVLFDEAYAKELSKSFNEELYRLRKAFEDETGMKDFNVNKSGDIVDLCNKYSISYKVTDKGNPITDRNFLESSNHPALKSVVDIRELQKIKNDFVDKPLSTYNQGGRIYCSYRSVRGDGGGTRTGRFSSNKPNMQQIPARSKYGKLVRGMYIPDEGYKWCKADYSQQEPAIMLHYALRCHLEGSEEAREYLVSGNKIYDYISEATNLDYSTSKAVSLGRMYGMGAYKLAGMMGVEKEEAQKILNDYDAKVPMVSQLSGMAMRRAENKGEIRTVMGRRRTFRKYLPTKKEYDEEGNFIAEVPLEYDEACEKWGANNIKRAFVYRALNSMLQGSGADMMKKAMINLYKESGTVPYMLVHDELNAPVKDMDEALYIKNTMENALPLEVPISVDIDYIERWK